LHRAEDLRVVEAIVLVDDPVAQSAGGGQLRRQFGLEDAGLPHLDEARVVVLRGRKVTSVRMWALRSAAASIVSWR